MMTHLMMQYEPPKATETYAKEMLETELRNLSRKYKELQEEVDEVNTKIVSISAALHAMEPKEDDASVV